LPEDLVELFLRFRFQRFPHRAWARLRRQIRPPPTRSSAVPDGTFQRPRQVIVVVGGQQAQYARGFVFRSGGCGSVHRKTARIRAELGKALLHSSYF